MNKQRVFTIWFGFGAPVYFFGALWLAFLINPYLGCAILGLYIWRIYNSFNTTCSRCSFYGTFKCGLQGKVVSLLFRKKTDSISTNRIKIHFFTDLLFIGLAYMIYLSYGILPALLAAIWPIGAWLISLGPKKYHGLMWRLRKNELTF